MFLSSGDTQLGPCCFILPTGLLISATLSCGGSWRTVSVVRVSLWGWMCVAQLPWEAARSGCVPVGAGASGAWRCACDADGRGAALCLPGQLRSLRMHVAAVVWWMPGGSAFSPELLFLRKSEIAEPKPLNKPGKQIRLLSPPPTAETHRGPTGMSISGVKEKAAGLMLSLLFFPFRVLMKIAFPYDRCF